MKEVTSPEGLDQTGHQTSAFDEGDPPQELVALLNNWPALSPDVRSAIVALCRALTRQ